MGASKRAAACLAKRNKDSAKPSPREGPRKAQTLSVRRYGRRHQVLRSRGCGAAAPRSPPEPAGGNARLHVVGIDDRLGDVGRVARRRAHGACCCFWSRRAPGCILAAARSLSARRRPWLPGRYKSSCISSWKSFWASSAQTLHLLLLVFDALARLSRSASAELVALRPATAFSGFRSRRSRP